MKVRLCGAAPVALFHGAAGVISVLTPGYVLTLRCMLNQHNVLMLTPHPIMNT